VGYGFKVEGGGERRGGFGIGEPVVDAKGITWYRKVGAGGGC
jgi:hypothetical protein